MRHRYILFLLIIICFALPPTTVAETKLLVDFGSSASGNIFNESEFPGWNTVLKGSHTTYVSLNGYSGTMVTSGDGRFDDYQGISGPAMSLQKGHQIVVTWYNTTGSNVEIQPLVSVTDLDNPESSAGQPQWYVMSKVKIPAGQSSETTYEILAEFSEPLAISAGNRSVINVSINSSSKQNKLICDKIEIRDIDSTPPSKPENLVINSVTTSKASLIWTSSTDNVGVDKYLIYANEKIVGESFTNSFDVPLLTPDKYYSFQVLAMDEKRNKSPLSDAVNASTSQINDSRLVDPNKDIAYLGAFKLPTSSNCTLVPGDRDAECSWSYASGGGLTYLPNGDPSSSDAYPGSLMGLGYTKYASELTIPEPVNSRDVADLNRAVALKDFTKIFYENGSYNDQAVAGLAYLPAKGSQTRDKLYYSRGHQHKESYAGITNKTVTHGLAHADLVSPIIPSSWILGPLDQKPNYFSYHSILFTIPDSWATSNGIPGYVVASSGYRDGAAPDGPGIILTSPWTDQDPWPGVDQNLSYRTLLEYEDGKGIEGVHAADYWEGGDWIKSGTKEGVVFVSKKGYGEYWYGIPEGPEASHFDVPSYPSTTYKSWKATRFGGVFAFFNPDDLARVVKSEQGVYQQGDPEFMDSWEPQPYAAFDLSAYYYNDQNVRALAADRVNGYLYAFESNAEGSLGVVHVFKIGSDISSKLTVVKTGTGAQYGTIESDLAGINCGYTCQAYYETNSSITLSATSTINANFTGWSGAGCSGTGDCVVSLDSAKSVTANFEYVHSHILSITKKKGGSGSVTSSPAGISCGSDCQEVYVEGTEVTLSATPFGNAEFLGWSGDADCSDGYVMLDTDVSCTATFSSFPWILFLPAITFNR